MTQTDEVLMIVANCLSAERAVAVRNLEGMQIETCDAISKSIAEDLKRRMPFFGVNCFLSACGVTIEKD